MFAVKQSCLLSYLYPIALLLITFLEDIVSKNCFISKWLKSGRVITNTSSSLLLSNLSQGEYSRGKSAPELFILPSIQNRVTSCSTVFSHKLAKLVNTGYMSVFLIRKNTLSVLREVILGQYVEYGIAFQAKGHGKNPLCHVWGLCALCYYTVKMCHVGSCRHEFFYFVMCWFHVPCLSALFSVQCVMWDPADLYFALTSSSPGFHRGRVFTKYFRLVQLIAAADWCSWLLLLANLTLLKC